jgi:YHS domain-containing protein
MKTVQYLKTLALSAALILTVNTVSAAKPVNTSFFGNKAIDGYDTVAYHTQKQAVKGSKQFAYEWQGANWWFASAKNRDTFKADPTKYAPQYGGYCAWAAASNKIADTDPELWNLFNGKLYLNYNKKTQSEWQADKVSMVKRGDYNFPKLIK